MSTSQKHRNFVSEPMKNKPVTELAGVGNTLGRRLDSAGYGKANAVLGQYLVQNRNQAQFQDWMKNTSGANKKQSGDTYRCLNEWSEEFL